MKKFLIIFALFGLILTSCEEDEVTPEDPDLTKANIEGTVNLFDEFGTPVNKWQMIVSAKQGEYLNFWGETEKDGSFIILNAKYHSNYTIVYEKEGFGTYKKFAFNHENTGGIGQITGTPTLGEKSSTTVDQLKADVIDESLELDVTLGDSNRRGKKYIRFLFHTIPQISNKVFSHYTGRFTMVSNSHTLVLTKEYLQEIGLESGVEYYVQCYGASYYSNGYFDEDELRYVLPNLGFPENGSTPTESFIMP